MTTEDYKTTFYNIAQLVTRHSNVRLRLAFNEGDENDEFENEAGHFLKLDEKRLGRDIELYCFMGTVAGWEQTLATFLMEILLPLKNTVPESYAAGSEALRSLGESVYPENMLHEWRSLF